MVLATFGNAIVSKITELLVQPAFHQISHVFCFNNFLQEFREQKENLISVQPRIQNDVSAAQRNSEEIEGDVLRWLRDAAAGMEAAERLENQVGHIASGNTWCPSCIRQYKLSKKLEKIAERLKKIAAEGTKFQNVSHKPPIQDIEFLPSADFKPSESSKEAFDQILKALKDENINMVGLYGMGGVGKTTLVKEVGRKAKEWNLFDQVLIVVVSQAPDVSKIQDHMADILGLRFEERSVEGRSSRLWQRLTSEKTMLIILDDVWKHLDLKHIGIPSGSDHNGCKILLTTRLQPVCSSMKCQQKIPLKVLSEREAWDLFKVNAGVSDDSALREVAVKVAKECRGLPIALVTVGRALREKSAVEWKVALKKLKNSQLLHIEYIDEEKNAYACLKLSYDYLKRKETKLCFLFCCLFPEDYEIPIEHLTRYAVGFGMYQDVESVEDAREQVQVTIENLKDCCLLLDTRSEEHVRMHDLVRDVAVQIASQEHGFMVKAGLGLKEWPRNIERFEGYTAISLIGTSITELPDGLVCPELKILILDGENLNVPDKFFEGMGAIEVLTLKGGSLSLKSLEFLTKLRFLELFGCQCEDLASLTKLFRVDILSIHNSSIKLPDEMGGRKKLGLLEWTQCQQLNVRRLHLVRFSDIENIIPEVHEGCFEVCTELKVDDCHGMQEILELDGVDEANNMLLSGLRTLTLQSLKELKCIWKGPTQQVSLQSLVHLKIHYCMRLSFIFTPSLARSLSQLETIDIFACPELEEIIARDSVGNDLQCLCFPNLREIKVRSCTRMKRLFPVTIAAAFPRLRDLQVKEASQITDIFGQDDKAASINVEREIVLPDLLSLSLEYLPSLSCFCPASYAFKFPCLNWILVKECRKIATKFITTPDGVQSQASNGCSGFYRKRTPQGGWEGGDNCDVIEEILQKNMYRSTRDYDRWEAHIYCVSPPKY